LRDRSGQQKADHGQRRTGRQRHPEGGVDLAAGERLALDDGVAQSLVDEELAERDEDGRQGDQAEVGRVEQVGEDGEYDQRQDLAAPGVDQRPPQAARDALLEGTAVLPVLAGRPFLARCARALLGRLGLAQLVSDSG
jgi:hypothetical protein